MKYEDVNQEVIRVINKVLEKHFEPILENNVVIKAFFVNERSKSNGKVVLAKISKASDRIKYFTQEDAVDGCDYVLDIDKKAWKLADEEDRVRLIRHELRHIDLSLKRDGSLRMGIAPHDFEDFRTEVELNDGNVDWANRLAFLVDTEYDQEKELAD